MLTPSLTGFGERQHVAARETSLDTHVDDIANLIAWEERSGIPLVLLQVGEPHPRPVGAR